MAFRMLQWVGRAGKGQSWTRRALVGAMAVAVLAAVAAPILINRHAEAAWYNTSWLYRRKITIDNSASGTNLANFPVLIKLNSSRIDYAKAQSAGQDIRFTDPSAPTTALPHEIESWNTAGNSFVWVKVPQLTAGSSTGYIYMYYGNAAAADGQNKTGVWDSNFAAVWHLYENPANTAPQIRDSTSNGRNGTANGSMTASNQITGQVNGALSFNGSSNYISFGSLTPLINVNALTISVWLKRTAAGGEVLALKSSASYNDNVGIELAPDGKAYFHLSPTGDSAYGTVASNDTNWHYCVLRYDGTQTGNANRLRGYIDGVAQTLTFLGTVPATTTTDTGSFNIARQVSNYGAQSTDEERISTTPRSADWIKAEYLTMTDAMNSFAGEENVAPSAPVLTAVTNPSSTLPVFQMRATDNSEPDYLRYKIDVCSASDCSTIVRTIDQTASQTGWSGQDTQSGTAYVSSATLSGSTLATHTYQAPALTGGTQYWWRAYAIDPGGSNVFSSPSSIGAFVVNGTAVRITGGTRILGGTKIGPGP